MDLKQNTEFILTKIDSLMQGAMPYLEKGSEEVIKYQLVKFWAEWAITFILVFCLAYAVLKVCKKLYSLDDEKDIFMHNYGLPIFIVGTLGFIVSIALFIVSCIEFTSLILSFTYPEMFAIMELLGK